MAEKHHTVAPLVVGDRVKVVQRIGLGRVGEIVRVTGTQRPIYWVQLAPDEEHAFWASEIERVSNG